MNVPIALNKDPTLTVAIPTWVVSQSGASNDEYCAIPDSLSLAPIHRKDECGGVQRDTKVLPASEG